MGYYRGILCVLGMLATSAVVADGPGPHPQAMAFIEERLELDETQRALFSELQEARQQQRARQRTAFAELRQLVEADSLDQAAVAALAARMADDVESQVIDNAQLMHEFRHSLTAEQRDKLASFEQWREERGTGGRPGWLPPPPEQ